MIRTLSQYVDLLNGAGLRYWLYWTLHEVKKRTGILRLQFPIQNPQEINLTFKDWRLSEQRFLFESKSHRPNHLSPSSANHAEVERIKSGEVRFFSGEWLAFIGEYKWVTNVKTGRLYSTHQHWSDISTFYPGEDIKYVWEPARFDYLFPLLQYDSIHSTDNSPFVIKEILSFINHAPINAGPHYMSSQEMAIRVMNWISFLQFYKHSEALTESIFHKITNSIFAHCEHIYHYIGFSKNLVRNNHILNESAALYTVGCLFSDFKESAKFKQAGWDIFEGEIEFQFFEDGTYLQYSNNYHRVAIRIFTWMLALGKLHGNTFNENTIKKGIRTLAFMRAIVDESTGCAPNYGNNDGSLLFPFTGQSYSDYRPYISTFALALGKQNPYPSFIDDARWFGLDTSIQVEKTEADNSTEDFNSGGYYILNSSQSKTVIRCGSHQLRPSQADNLHIDIFWKGINLMRDSGTYQYNCEPSLATRFFGTEGHNTVMVNNLDQMLKGPRFVWFYWTKSLFAQITLSKDSQMFTGRIKAFRQSGKWITHERQVEHQEQGAKWTITDTILNDGVHDIKQFWHPHPDFTKYFKIVAVDGEGNQLEPHMTKAFYSPTYGVIEEAIEIIFNTSGNKIITTISMLAESDN